MAIWFTADTHFGHQRIIDLCARPLDNVEAMDDLLIKNWNLKVAPDDIIYHLGDVSAHSTRPISDYLSRLNGCKILIRGNHDNDEICAAPQWDNVYDYLEIDLDLTTDLQKPYKLVLFHYPIADWNGYQYGKSIHLHGHCHGRTPTTKRRCDVGVDQWGFTPVRFEDIKARMDNTTD